MTLTFLDPPLFLSRDKFRAYVNGLQYGGWRPRMPYLHNTAVPSLKQVKEGKENELRWGVNLNHYYRGMGWHAGPHAVSCIDGLLVLCDFTQPGVAQSCSNALAWAIEMLGNYEVGGDDFSSGDGAKVRDNAAFAIAVIADKLGWGDLSDFAFNVRGLHLHHDCARDHHCCPGSKVQKADMLARIAIFRETTAPPTPLSPHWRSPPSIASGEDIQAALNRLKIDPREAVGGIYGQTTKERVSAFQRASALDVDGWVGPLTSAAIVKALTPEAVEIADGSS